MDLNPTEDAAVTKGHPRPVIPDEIHTGVGRQGPGPFHENQLAAHSQVDQEDPAPLTETGEEVLAPAADGSHRDTPERPGEAGCRLTPQDPAIQWSDSTRAGDDGRFAIPNAPAGTCA